MSFTTVKLSSGVKVLVTNKVKDSDGNIIEVSDDVKDSDGNPYTVFTSSVDVVPREVFYAESTRVFIV